MAEALLSGQPAGAHDLLRHGRPGAQVSATHSTPTVSEAFRPSLAQSRARTAASRSRAEAEQCKDVGSERRVSIQGNAGPGWPFPVHNAQGGLRYVEQPSWGRVGAPRRFFAG